MQLLVLGCHRSGTSLCTRLLSMMGASVGPIEGMKAANIENPKGFWEHDEVVDLNKLILQRAGLRWDRLSTYDSACLKNTMELSAPTLGREALRLVLRFDAQRPWVTKDPRMCITLPFWLPVLEAPVAVLVHRHPLEIARSLQRRNPLMPMETGLGLWELYTLEALRHTAGMPRVLVSYHDLMADAVAVSGMLLENLEQQGVSGLHMPAPEEIKRFIDPGLHREKHEQHDTAKLLNRKHADLLHALESGDALAWPEVPSHSEEAQEALERYDAMSDDAPERLLANTKWNMARMLEMAEQMQKLRGQAERVEELKNAIEVARGARDLERAERKQAEIAAAAAANKLERAINEQANLRAKISELRAAMQAWRQEAIILREDLKRVLQAAEEIESSDWWKRGARMRLFAESFGAKPLSPTLAFDRTRDALARAVDRFDMLRKSFERKQEQVAARTADNRPNRSAYQADLQYLRKHYGRLEWCDDAMERQRWWQLGCTARRMMLPVMTAEVANAARHSAELRRQAVEAFRRAENNVRLATATQAELEEDRRQLIDAIERLDAVLRARANSGWWRRFSGMRRRMGEAGLMKRDFRLPSHDAAEAREAFRQWRDALKGASDRYTRKPPPPPVAPAAVAAAVRVDPEQSIYYQQVKDLLQDAEAELHDVCSDSEAAIANYLAAPLPQALPLVSIIMPAYNREALIGQAIESVLQQSYPHWELIICDDGSTDGTVAAARRHADARIRVLELPHQGAAAARNAGLAEAQGPLKAYLDSDNIWHPAYLDIMVRQLATHTGHYCAFSKYLDVIVREDGSMKLKRYTGTEFSYEQLQERNFVDLNSFMHRAALYQEFGGFTEALPRMQDWDLVLKYAFLRDPLAIDACLTLYRRNEAWGQITTTQSERQEEARALVMQNLSEYYATSLPVKVRPERRRKVSILSWDICRNHFSKAYNLAEALHTCGDYDVQLVGFRFFEEPIFEPYRGVEPPFRAVFLDGAELPQFEEHFARALAAIDGDIIYCVKPRMPSLGLALLHNYHFGTPIIMEANDSEVHVHHAGVGQEEAPIDLMLADPAGPEWKNPYSQEWSRVMDMLAKQLPFIATHNVNLDRHYGMRSFCMRNFKDEHHFEPLLYDRAALRKELGFKPEDRVILFGGLVRKHKGVFELIELVRSLGDPRYKLLFVGSRNSPDLEKIKQEHAHEAVILPPQDRNEMAKINYAADLVVLWLDPAIPASHYQMPYKLTDALAMKAPVIANDVSDLGELGRQGYLKLAPHGDRAALQQAVRDIFDYPAETARMVEAGRRLYLRQFSYAAARRNMDLVYAALMQQGTAPLPAAKLFAEWYARVHEASGMAYEVAGK